MEPKDLQTPDLAVRVDEDDGHDRRIPPRRLGGGNSDPATVHGDGLSDEYPGASVGDVHRDGYADAQGRMEPVELDVEDGQRSRRALPIVCVDAAKPRRLDYGNWLGRVARR